MRKLPLARFLQSFSTALTCAGWLFQRSMTMAKTACDKAPLHELLYQALETRIGGIEIYKTAITCAVNDDLRKE